MWFLTFLWQPVTELLWSVWVCRHVGNLRAEGCCEINTSLCHKSKWLEILLSPWISHKLFYPGKKRCTEKKISILDYLLQTDLISLNSKMTSLRKVSTWNWWSCFKSSYFLASFIYSVLRNGIYIKIFIHWEGKIGFKSQKNCIMDMFHKFYKNIKIRKITLILAIGLITIK